MVTGTKFSASNSTAFGIVQVSCGLHVQKFRHGIRGQRFTELDKKDVDSISRGLGSAFSPDKQFLLEGLAAGSQKGHLEHTWLGDWSRHQPNTTDFRFFMLSGV